MTTALSISSFAIYFAPGDRRLRQSFFKKKGTLAAGFGNRSLSPRLSGAMRLNRRLDPWFADIADNNSAVYRSLNGGRGEVNSLNRLHHSSTWARRIVSSIHIYGVTYSQSSTRCSARTVRLVGILKEDNIRNEVLA